MTNHQLSKLMAERIVAGLQRKSVTTCSRWAEKYRIMGQPHPGPWSFKYFPWLREMHDSDAEMNVGQKSSQVGFTETVLNKTFFNIDVRKVDCLYVLPNTSPDASTFSAGRFDPALELSPHLANIFSDVKNVNHKRAGAVNLYVRGSHARAGLKSVPIGFLVLDEVDEMEQKNIPLAIERTSGQMSFSVWMVSTATFENHGINGWFRQSSQNHFFFPCPSCRRHIELTFPESIVITADGVDDPRLEGSHLICTACKARLPHETKSEWLADGRWVESVPGRSIKGWHINRLYSSAAAARPHKIAEQWLRGQSDKAVEQEFYNSSLGLPHVVEGGQVTDREIDDCRGDYPRGTLPAGTGPVTMGIDVQPSQLYYVLCEWAVPPYGTAADVNAYSRCRVLHYGKVRDFTELDELLIQFGVRYAVVDAQPERRNSLAFCNRFYGLARMCWYPNGISGKTLHLNDGEQSVSVDRTTWLDLALGRYHRGKPWITLPRDIDQEFRDHIKAQVRRYEVDKNGNPVGRYLTLTGRKDDYGHAQNFAEIALPLALGVGAASDITTSIV